MLGAASEVRKSYKDPGPRDEWPAVATVVVMLCCCSLLLLLCAGALTVFSIVVVSAIDSRVARFQSVPVGEVRWPGARVRCDVGVCCLSAFEAQATFGRSSPPSIM